MRMLKPPGTQHDQFYLDDVTLRHWVLSTVA
jgi:hypothetical protein